MVKIQFKGWKCYLDIAQYNNGRIAIQLFDCSDNCPVAKATVNLPDVKIPENSVIIKNYSENEGIAEVLMEAKIIGENLGDIRSGHILCGVHKFLRTDLIKKIEIMERFKVVKVSRKSGNKKLLGKNLTREDAQIMVKSYPNSKTSMVYFTEH